MVVRSDPQQLAPLHVAIIVGGRWARAECQNWQGEFRATTSRCRWSGRWRATCLMQDVARVA